MEKSDNDSPLQELFDQPLDIVSIGLDSFASELAAQGVEVVGLDWKPPANGDPELADLLSRLGC